MKNESTNKLLYLLNLLSSGEYSKKEIIAEFEKKKIKVNKTSLYNYIEKLKENKIPIKTRIEKGRKIYSLKKTENKITLEKSELSASDDVKKLLLAQKNPDNIRYAMRVFYKFAKLISKENTRRTLAGFGYYSKINWTLLSELYRHCREKNIITLEYIKPDGTTKPLTIHADTIKSGNWTDRLYLGGVLEGNHKLSKLPVDRIFRIKKVKASRYRFDMEVGVLTYKISREAFESCSLEPAEAVSEAGKNYVVLKRPLDDSFSVIQRLMYFCPDLYYISDDGIRELVKEKLCILRDMYGGEVDK